tara:strand:+ start:13 stop:612 length:600 start_codon:yes stop_codon:yes gene_type:complete
MIKQYINIVNFPILYNILEEIKNNLPFNIFDYSDEENFLKYSEINKIDIKKSIFLVKEKENFLYKKLKIEKNQIFEITKLPIKIDNLIEKINIQLIKQRYSHQSKFFLKKYILDINSRQISKSNIKLKLTEKEIDTILFLNGKKKPQNIKILLSEVWGYMTGIETHTVETHIYRLRKKIAEKFKDNKFILSSDDGYSIE